MSVKASVGGYPWHRGRRKRVLVVNCYLDDTRDPIPRTHKVPQAMGPVYLAGVFSRHHCDVRLYNEQASGPLEDEGLLGWPDMLVLTGLATALDRMLHLTAYARTKNPRVIVVAGGHGVRALPLFCQRFFDYSCLGDLEDLKEIVEEALGPTCAAEQFEPRYDLANWLGRIGYVETSRNCNFRCSFCTLTAEGRKYQGYDLDSIRRQIESMGKRQYITFLDNNFYGPDKRHFAAKLELIGQMWRAGYFEGWSALVTSDFFFEEENLAIVREAGCKALFSGVESLDRSWLQQVNKPQNALDSQIEFIHETLDAGIVFLYGLVLDVTRRSIEDMRRELEFILERPDITLPSYVSIAIPLLKTPFFYECLERGLLLPGTRLRDLDGSTLCLRPLDPLDDVMRFVRTSVQFNVYRARLLRHALGFARRYRSNLGFHQMILALSNVAALGAPITSSGRGIWRKRRRDRTYLSTTDVLDRLYQPAFPLPSRYAGHFQPTRVTDAAGNLSEDVAEDLVGSRAAISLRS